MARFPVPRAISRTVRSAIRMARSLGVEGRVGHAEFTHLGERGLPSELLSRWWCPDPGAQVIAPIHDPVEMDHDIQVAASFLADEEP